MDGYKTYILAGLYGLASIFMGITSEAGIDAQTMMGVIEAAMISALRHGIAKV